MWRCYGQPMWRSCSPFVPTANKVYTLHTTLFLRTCSTSSSIPPTVVERVKVSGTTSPIIALVGRPNVGKSTLFNRLLRGDKRTITDPTAGTTRDRTYAAVRWYGRNLVIVDTGGIVYEGTTKDSLAASIREQAMIGITEADAIVLVLDVRDGITASDLDVAKILRLKSKDKPIIIAVNKADNEEMKGQLFEDRKLIYDRLGLGEAVPISAIHGDGILDLVEKITNHFPEHAEEEENPKEMRIAIVGAPNAGKSSLLNKVVGFERSVVSPVAGTTADPVDTLLTWREQHTVRLIDTAGIKRKAHTQTGLQRAAVLWALKAIQRAHVVVLLIDALVGVTDHDVHVAQFVLDHHKSVVVGVNKWDLYPRLKREAQLSSIESERHKVRAIKQESVFHMMELLVKRLFWRMEPFAWHKHIHDVSKSIMKQEKLKDIEERKKDPTKQQTKTNKPTSNLPIDKHSEGGVYTLETDYKDLLQTKEERSSHTGGNTVKSGENVEAVKISENYRAEVSVDPNIDPELGIDIKALEEQAIAAFEAEGVDTGEEEDEGEDSVDIEKEHEPQIEGAQQGANSEQQPKKRGKGNWEAEIQQEYQEAIMVDLKFLPFVPIKFVSAVTGFSVPSLIDKAVSVFYEREKRIKTHELLEIIKHANMTHRPPSKGAKAVRIKFAAQADLYPPTFIFWVNNPDAIHPSYKRFLENNIRDRFPYEGTPIRLLFRTGKPIWKSKSSNNPITKAKRKKEKSLAEYAEKKAVMKAAKKVKAAKIREQKARAKSKEGVSEDGEWKYEAKPRLERGKKPFSEERKKMVAKVLKASRKPEGKKPEAKTHTPGHGGKTAQKRRKDKIKAALDAEEPREVKSKRWEGKVAHVAQRLSRK